jgi:hypothetical protein
LSKSVSSGEKFLKIRKEKLIFSTEDYNCKFVKINSSIEIRNLEIYVCFIDINITRILCDL